jgi:hypothetical protein
VDVSGVAGVGMVRELEGAKALLEELNAEKVGTQA